MNKNLLYLLSILLLTVACEEDLSTYVVDPANIAGEIRSEVTLDADTHYYLNGDLIVEKGGVLNIPAGTLITAQGNTSSYIGVAQGGKIYAKGSATQPIVFTSDIKEPGSWGGLVICGEAPTNLMMESGQAIQAEVSDMLYGGDEVDDNSGELSYVRVEYSGYYYNDDKQFNGFSFFGVGSETVIEYISSYQSQDDGIEFFGGNVDARFLVSIGSHDDGIDFTDGWSGQGTYWYAYDSEKSGIEGSNNDIDGGISPRTSATLSNITVYKMGQRPWYFKDGAGTQLLDNVVIGGLTDSSGDAYFYYEENDVYTNSNILSGSIALDNIRFVNRGVGNDTDATGSLTVNINQAKEGAGAWSNDDTLEPLWLGTWAKPTE